MFLLLYPSFFSLSHSSLFFSFAYPQSENESSWGLRLHCSLTIQNAIIWILNRNRRSRNIEFAWNRKPWSAPVFAQQAPPLPRASNSRSQTTHLYFRVAYLFFSFTLFFFLSLFWCFLFFILFFRHFRKKKKVVFIFSSLLAKKAINLQKAPALIFIFH